ncbi:unnamed protein product [Caenorhabditis bovis]|uniref:TIL domain-containing protein n=1 Tax=Caenorhabditis bovis TaxID=2654633 RepID=A0A8S1EIA5_9PELO|nr:unnamed protein product [Caenorhabditis bovis]
MKFVIVLLALISIAACVDIANLNDTKPTCKENEQVMECGTACEPSCEDPDPVFCTKQCLVNVCQCKKGFVRDPASKECVKLDQCQKTVN